MNVTGEAGGGGEEEEEKNTSVRLIKMCLNETYSKVRKGTHFPDGFPIRNGL
jgi:hypothetical protein